MEFEELKIIFKTKFNVILIAIYNEHDTVYAKTLNISKNMPEYEYFEILNKNKITKITDKKVLKYLKDTKEIHSDVIK